MVRQVILHIGTHKTGTTSIQDTLAGFDDGVRIYADFEENNHSLPLFTAFSRNAERYHLWLKRGLGPDEIRARRASYRARLERNLDRGDRETLILSGEDVGFLGAAEKAALVETLGRRDRRVVVVCYVRPPTSFAASITQQNIRGGATAVPDRVSAGYAHRIRPFLDLLPRKDVIVREFDRGTLRNGSVVADFLALCGLDPAAIPEKTTNEGLSAAALKLALAFNRSTPCQFGDEIVFRARQALVHRLATLYRAGPRIDPARFRCIAGDEDVDWLKAEFGIDFAEPGAADDDAAQLDRWLGDLSDVDLGPLSGALDGHGISGRFDTAEAMLNRLYYHLVHLETARRAGTALHPSDAGLLHTAALSAEGGRRLTRNEARRLLTLAARARPNGTRIRRTLEEWTRPD